MNSKMIGDGTRALDRMSSLLELDALTVQQYAEQWHGSGYLQPEKGLMLAVLLDAIESFQKYAVLPGPYANRLFKDSEKWIFADDRKWAFSFINICEAVGLDPQYMRKGLSQWKQRTMAKSLPARDKLALSTEEKKRLAEPRRSSLPRRSLAVRREKHFPSRPSL